MWGRATQMAKAVCYWKAEMPTGGPVWGLERWGVGGKLKRGTLWASRDMLSIKNIVSKPTEKSDTYICFTNISPLIG